MSFVLNQVFKDQPKLFFTGGWKHCFLFLSLLLFSGLSFSQNTKADTVFSFPQTIYLDYMNSVGSVAKLYNGAEYEGSYPLVLGTPFWNTARFEAGQVCFNGVVYHGVPMAYDLVRDELVIKNFQQLSIRLDKAKLNYFVLAGHTFVHLWPDTADKNFLPDDIYDLLYDGDVKLYAKRTKTIARSFHAESQDAFAEHASYFLCKDGAYYRVADDDDLQDIFKNEKKALKTFWKSGNLSFKKDPESFIIQTITYWSQLKK